MKILPIAIHCNANTHFINMNNSTPANGTESSRACCDGTEPNNYIQISKYIWTYGAPILFILGTIGNLLTGIVMLRKRQRQYTTSVYIVVLACLDTVLLYMGISKYWIQAIWDIDVTILSGAGCKLYYFLATYLSQFEAWILVCVAVERVVAVWSPLRVQTIFTRKVAVIQVATIGLVLAGISVHTLWTRDIIVWHSMTLCKLNTEYVEYVWGLTNMVLASIIPFVVMIVSSILIVTKIQISRFRRVSGAGLKMSSITAMLLTVCIAFVVFSLPARVLFPMMPNLIAVFGCCYTMYLIKPVAAIFLVSNYVVNFWLYCASGSKFREELRTMLACTRKSDIRHTAAKPVQAPRIENESTRSKRLGCESTTSTQTGDESTHSTRIGDESIFSIETGDVSIQLACTGEESTPPIKIAVDLI
jgi:hypothetical protein